MRSTDEGKTDDAMAIFQAVIADYPELPEPRNNLAVLYAQKGEYAQARDELERAIQTAPDYAVAHENLGDVYARLAEVEYEQTIALDKRNRTAEPKLKLIRDDVSPPRPIERSHSPMMRRCSGCAASLAFAVASGPALAAHPQVELDTTAGTIKLELYPEAAPKTVENFLAYVKSGHYEGTQFHRVIKGFMIQGGGYDATFREAPRGRRCRSSPSRASRRAFRTCPARLRWRAPPNPNSATSQFFINVANNKPLDFRSPDAQGYGYTVFGKVVAGMDVVEKIANAPTGAGGPFPTDVPVERVMIKSARVVTPAS